MLLSFIYIYIKMFIYILLKHLNNKEFWDLIKWCPVPLCWWNHFFLLWLPNMVEYRFSFLAVHGFWDLSSPTRGWTAPSAVTVLTTGPPESSLDFLVLKYCLPLVNPTWAWSDILVICTWILLWIFSLMFLSALVYFYYFYITICCFGSELWYLCYTVVCLEINWWNSYALDFGPI